MNSSNKNEKIFILTFFEIIINILKKKRKKTAFINNFDLLHLSEN
jgi:hypothetical protein